MNSQSPNPRWRIAIGGYGPTLLFGTAEGAVLASMVLGARDVGADLALAGLTALALAVGGILATLPSAVIVARLGERASLIAAGLVGCGAAVLLVISTEYTSYVIAIAVIGAVGAVFKLARQSYLASVLPPERRGIGMSTLGGVMRAGLTIGPLAAGAALAVSGFDAVFVVVAVLMLAAGLTSLTMVGSVPAAPGGSEVPTASMLGTLSAYRRAYALAGGVAVSINLLRSVRPIVLPLWGQVVGVSDVEVALLLALSAAVELLLFIPGGLIMDRWGRRAAAIPAALIMGIGISLLALAVTHQALIAVAILIGVGYGLSSGLIMTLAADIALPRDRPAFLGWWRLLSEGGMLAGAGFVAAGVALAGLTATIVAFLPIGALAAIWAAVALGRPQRPV